MNFGKFVMVVGSTIFVLGVLAEITTMFLQINVLQVVGPVAMIGFIIAVLGLIYEILKGWPHI